MSQKVLIVGAGLGLSASLARQCHTAGMKVALVARDGEKAIALNGAILSNTLRASTRARDPNHDLSLCCLFVLKGQRSSLCREQATIFRVSPTILWT